MKCYKIAVLLLLLVAVESIDEVVLDPSFAHNNSFKTFLCICLAMVCGGLSYFELRVTKVEA